MSGEWYLYKDQQQQGPIDWEKLVEQAKEGIVGPADMVWTEGMTDWSRADQVEGLIAAVPPPPPEPVSTPPPSPKPDTFHAPPAGTSSPLPAGNPEQPGMASPAAGQRTSTGLEPNIAGLLCYILGWITGIIFFLVESENKFVRFHAMQSIITFGGLTVLQVLINIFNRLLWSMLWRGFGSWTLAGALTSLLGIVSLIIWLATVILAVLLMVKAYQNETFKLPIAGKIAEKQLEG